MRISVETLTANDAQALLLASVGQRQRPLSNDRVGQYARQMRAGKWRVTHQAVAIDPDGVVFDGQHRLSAIVKAGVPVTLTIARDADPATFDVIDVGRTRSPGHALAIAGYQNVNVLASSSRHFLVYKELIGTTRSTGPDIRTRWASHDIVEFLGTIDGDRVLGSLPDANRLANNLGQIGAKTWLTAAIALLRSVGVNDELRAEFTDRMESGLMLDATSPILAFRRWMTNYANGYKTVRSDARAFTGMAAFVKCWNSWLEGEPVQQVTFRAGLETVPAVQQHRTEALLDRETELIATGR